MNCPNCGKPMEEGVLDSRGPIRWTDSASGMSIPASAHDILLGKALGLLRQRLISAAAAARWLWSIELRCP